MKKERPVAPIVAAVLGAIGLTYLIVTAALFGFAHGNDARIVAVVFAALGSGLLMAAVTVFAVSRHKAAAKELLLATGQRAEATVTSVEQNPYVRINNVHPWVIVAEVQHPYTYEKLTVRSGNYRQKPPVQPGDTLAVYFDQMNDKRYAIDLKSIM